MILALFMTIVYFYTMLKTGISKYSFVGQKIANPPFGKGGFLVE